MNRLRVAVIGAGSFAEAGHLPGLVAHPRAEVVALCTRRPERGRELAARFAVPEVVADWAEVCARRDLDAVTICTANDEHRDAALAALAHGKHVLCEKPLAASVGAAEEMARAAAASGRVHVVAFTYRYLYGVRELRRRVRAGEVGEPALFRAHHEYWSTLHPQSTITWRERRPAARGGVLHDTGSHLFDLARFLVGDLAAVRGATLRVPRRRRDASTGELAEVETEDLAAAWMRFAGGAGGHWQASRVTPARAPAVVQILGEEGLLEAQLSRGRFDALRRARPSPSGRGEEWEELPLPPAAGDGEAHALPLMMAAFVDACLAGAAATDDATFADGLAVQRALAAVEVSAGAGWVSLESPSS
jgi:predicted dehydrogenase